MKRIRLLVMALGCALGTVQAAAAPSVLQITPAISTNVVGSTFTLTSVLPADLASLVVSNQWSLNGTNLVNSPKVAGAQESALTIYEATRAYDGIYRLQVTLNLLVSNQYTATATAYVIEMPKIIRTASEAQGDDLVLTVEATGGLLGYQWLWQGQPVPSGTNSILRLINAYTNANAGYYTVRVSNPLGEVVSSPGLLYSKPSVKGSYYGLFYETNGVSLDSSGYFQTTISSTEGAFSGKLFIGRKSYRFSGKLATDHTATVDARGASGSAPLILNLQLLTANSLPQMVGTISGTGWKSLLQANRRYYDRKLPTTLDGTYGLTLVNTNLSGTVPNGYGASSVKVKFDGTVNISCYLPDGASFSFKGYLSRLGDCPVHASLNRETGEFLGWIRVARQTNSSIQGASMAWIQTPGSQSVYPGGFALSLQPTGSTFAASTGPAILFNTGVATFAGGDLGTGQSNLITAGQVNYKDPRSYTGGSPENIRLKINKNGLMSGSFIHPLTKVKTSIRGAVLQQQKMARGYFISQGQSGAFNLDPGQ